MSIFKWIWEGVTAGGVHEPGVGNEVDQEFQTIIWIHCLHPPSWITRHLREVDGNINCALVAPLLRTLVKDIPFGTMISSSPDENGVLVDLQDCESSQPHVKKEDRDSWPHHQDARILEPIIDTFGTGFGMRPWRLTEKRASSVIPSTRSISPRVTEPPSAHIDLNNKKYVKSGRRRHGRYWIGQAFCIFVQPTTTPVQYAA